MLTIAAAQGLTGLNPVTKENAWQEALFPLMWNGLVKVDRNERLEPDLAASWKADASQKVWTFTLRPGVKFSNGKALTAADVVSTIEYYKDPGTATQLKNNVAPIATVEPGSGDSVVFTLKKPNALFPSSIQMVKIVDTGALAAMDKDPAVTGPFKVKEYVPNDHLVLERNPGYFGTKPPLDGIKIVKAADSSSAVTALRAGDLDVLWSVPLSQVSSIENDPRLAVVRPAVIGQYVSWEVDTTSPPFDDPKARQALAYAIDQAANLKAAYFGQGIVSTTNNPLPRNSPDHGGALTDYTYDLDKAKALFAEAGITQGSTLTWWGVAGQYPEWNISGQILQASLKKIGINLQIENTDIAAWAAKFYPAGKKFPGMIIPNFQSFPADPANEFLFLLKGRCECNWNNAGFDALYEKALATADDAERRAIWHQMQEIVNRQVPIYVPLQFATLTAAKRTVTGLWVDGAGNPHLESAGFAG
ncbi:ABC transporter substrate-binding protein [Sphaerisporangium krabiense]|uniref:Peptide/nickel transport system substrate-binding protein n=1 Tax=Sphaerisporangium krabiense TaxID=763782 RepID=A0A7W9DQ84_9ACTN|nr:ABC transporter substrate-binding protein [Sphaerisporangium krabiense]MBB5627143.1 peptide/nickel transport system substrate-binding protein [Sphaerisporangium krabiense]GII65300.1 ABC transporter substrate-binding protein [Sphaerisporangium krabiense]